MASIVLDQPSAYPSAIEQLRSALADPTLDIVYRRSSTGTWIDELGLPVLQSALDDGRAVTPLERDGDWVAALIHDPKLIDDEARVEQACSTVVAQIEDERLKAELRAQVRAEQASQARIVAASDRQRRLFERNLHDGAQQRLVGLALMLRLAGNRAADERSITDLLGEAVAELDEAIQDLRELARGLHPAIVTDAGLVAAIESLAEHPGIPVELSLELTDRLPERVEVGAYYLVAESITNANKHSGAETISVSARIVGDTLHVSVSDDGGGNAELSGSGLVGLADRLGSLGGYLVLDSEPASGTTVAGFIPLHPPTAAARHLVDDILLRVVPDDDGAGPYPAGTMRQASWIRGDQDRRRRALKWIAWQNHSAPGEFIDAQPEAEDLQHAKALLLFVGGNTKISSQRRNWILGYLTAAGYSEPVISAAAAYDDRDRIEEVMRLPRMRIVQVVLLYDALRAVAMDRTEFAPSDFDPVLRAADAIGISREVVADLHEIVIDEARLRQRRHRIVVAPTMPKLLNDSIAATRGGSLEDNEPIDFGQRHTR